MKYLKSLLLSLFLASWGQSVAAVNDTTEKHEAHEEEGITLSAAQQHLADIVVTPLTTKPITKALYAPAEIKANGYTSYLVSPRVSSMVIARHVSLGQHIKKGDVLVSLFSEQVGLAQGVFQQTYSEWQRVKKLGKTTVGESRFIKAQSDYLTNRSRLQAYGLSNEAIDEFIAHPLATVLGEYALYAAIDGVILSDDFQQGQWVEEGRTLMTLANEQSLWVEAQLSPNVQINLSKNVVADIRVGKMTYEGVVIQEAHTISPITRTRVVRLLVDNKSHQLHAGMFADVFFRIQTNRVGMMVSEEALIRNAEGHWSVFVEYEKNTFNEVEVTLGESSERQQEIIGLLPGTRIVTQGAFFIASQKAKGGFDPHNH